MATPLSPALALAPVAGSWILLAGPRRLNTLLLTGLARLQQGGPLRILDAGNRFNAYLVARAARGRPDILNHITVARAFTCHQVLTLLAATPAIAPGGVIVLDLLNTFYDESVPPSERKRLLRACVEHLQRLVRPQAPGATAAGLVSVHPPAIPGPLSLELLDILIRAAGQVHTFSTPLNPQAQPALF